MENQYCEQCGAEIIEARFTSPTAKHRFCSTQCTSDFFDARSTASGSVAAPKPDEVVFDNGPHNNWGMNAELYEEFSKLKSELTSLRQQLKEREESIKELLKVAEFYKEEFERERGGGYADGSHIVISRAKALLDKQ